MGSAARPRPRLEAGLSSEPQPSDPLLVSIAALPAGDDGWIALDVSVLAQSLAVSVPTIRRRLTTAVAAGHLETQTQPGSRTLYRLARYFDNLSSDQPSRARAIVNPTTVQIDQPTLLENAFVSYGGSPRGDANLDQHFDNLSTETLTQPDSTLATLAQEQTVSLTQELSAVPAPEQTTSPASSLSLSPSPSPVSHPVAVSVGASSAAPIKGAGDLLRRLREIAGVVPYPDRVVSDLMDIGAPLDDVIACFVSLYEENGRRWVHSKRVRAVYPLWVEAGRPEVWGASSSPWERRYAEGFRLGAAGSPDEPRDLAGYHGWKAGHGYGWCLENLGHP